MSHLRKILAASVFGVALFAVSHAQAGQSVGMVLDVEGTTTPQVEAFDEIAAGTKIELGEGSVVRFNFYPDCTELSVTQGSITFNEDEYEVEGGEEPVASNGACSTEIQASNSKDDAVSVPGAVVVRGDSPDVTFVVSGAKAAEANTLTLSHAGKAPIVIAKDGEKSVFKVPPAPISQSGDAKLTLADVSYDLSLADASGKELLTRKIVFGSENSDHPGTYNPVGKMIVRVELD